MEKENFEILDKSELLAYLKSGDKETRKSDLIAKKRLIYKTGDGFPYISISSLLKTANKAQLPTLPNSTDEYAIRAIINTTNIMDSHYDVHLPGLWDKSLKENKMIMHLQEHEMGFKYIISDGTELKFYTADYTWKALGFPYKGVTQALVFDSVLKKKGEKPRNEFMYEQYQKGYVKNHSVGMYYVKMVLCVNEPDDEYYGAEFEAWEKYFPMVVNQDFALEKGFFWLIKEAKCIEGSAVPIGSNRATPTLEIGGKNEPVGNNKSIDYLWLSKNLKIA